MSRKLEDGGLEGDFEHECTQMTRKLEDGGLEGDFEHKLAQMSHKLEMLGDFGVRF